MAFEYIDNEVKLKVVKWLYDDSLKFRCTGRSQFVALALVVIALENMGQWILIQDHDFTIRSNFILKNYIENILLIRQLSEFAQFKQCHLTCYFRLVAPPNIELSDYDRRS